MPVCRELARASRRERGRCVRHRHRARRIEATPAWSVEHVAGRADDGTGTAVGQDEHVGRPTARCRQKWCRIQAVGGNALASLASPRNGAVGHAPPAPCARWGVSRLTTEMECNITMSSTPGASTRMEALFDNRWFGKNSSTATPCNTVVRRRPARHGAMGRGSTRLPLLGAPAASSSRRRTTHGAIAQRPEHPVVDRKGAGSNPAGLAPLDVSRRPPARARCRTHLAPGVQQRASLHHLPS